MTEGSEYDQRRDESFSSALQKGTIVSFGGVSVGKAVHLALIVAIPALYGADIYGLFATGYIVSKVAVGISLFGVEQALLKFVPEAEEGSGKGRASHYIATAVLFAATVGTIIALALFSGGAGWIAEFLDLAGLGRHLRIMGMAVPFVAVGTVLVFTTRAQGEMRYKSVVQDIGEPFSILLVVILGGITGGEMWPAYGYLAWGLTAAGGGLWAYSAMYELRKLVASGLPFSTSVARRMLQYAAPLGGTRVLSLLGGKIDTLVIGYFLSPAHVGVYSVGVNLALSVEVILQSIGAMFSSLVARVREAAGNAGLRDLAIGTAKLAVVVTVPLVLVIFGAGEELVGLLGEEFRSQGRLIAILVGAHGLRSLGVASTFVVMLSGYPKLSFYNNCLFVLLLTVGGALLVPALGVAGMALVVGVAYVLQFTAEVVEMHQTLDIWIVDRELFLLATIGLLIACGELVVLGSFGDARFLVELVGGTVAALGAVAAYGVIVTRLGLLANVPLDRMSRMVTSRLGRG